MAAELGLLSLTQFQKKSQFRQIQSEPLMWNPNQIPQLDEDDDSWEVRAFEQDSSNVTWPPRSYTCTFCRREFRSAQALGGHMNVHRRDRARLHQAPPPLLQGTKIPASAATFLIPSQEILTTNGGGLCFVYSLPNPNGVSAPIGGLNTNFAKSPSSNFTSISTFDTNSFFQSCPAPSYNTSNSPSWKLLPVTSESKNPESNNFYCNESKKNSAVEELDLELRLGRR